MKAESESTKSESTENPTIILHFSVAIEITGDQAPNTAQREALTNNVYTALHRAQISTELLTDLPSGLSIDLIEVDLEGVTTLED